MFFGRRKSNQKSNSSRSGKSYEYEEDEEYSTNDRYRIITEDYDDDEVLREPKSKVKSRGWF